MVNRRRITKEELATLINLLSNRKTETGQQQLNDFWELLAEKYHFHSGHTLIHKQTGQIIDQCHHK
jgi:hypothetical protein